MKDFRNISAILLAAVFATAACTAFEPDNSFEKVRFQTARFVTGDATATKAPADYADDYGGVPFGAFSWYKGEDPADNTVFMTNQKVAYDSAEHIWSPLGTTYYWPAGGSLDFICYSPWSDTPPAVGEDGITFSAWNVASNPYVDLMYSDKSTGLSKNASTYYYNGVPVLFRHALARVSFAIKLAYAEATPSTGDKTKWEVTVDALTLKNLRTSGDLSLTLDSGEWKKPDSGVWTSDGAKTDVSLDCSALTTFTDTAPQIVCEPFLVLPQSLDQGQKVELKLTIKTWRDIGSGYPVEPFITEANVAVDASLGSISLTKWGINQSIKYNLVLTPTSGVSTDAPAEITFDPAVSEWENITSEANINI